VKASIAILPLVYLAAAVSAAPVPKAKPAEVELLPLATELFVGEPFGAFVRFTNRGEDEVFLFRDWHLQQCVGNVSLEVKGPKDKEFRCPYTVQYPLETSDGTRNPLKKGVKSGATRCEFMTLPWRDDGPEMEAGRFKVVGEWQVRGKVVFHNKEEKLSSPVVVKVSERAAAEARRHTDTLAELERTRNPTMTAFGDEFKTRMKLIDDLGACATAVEWRRQMFGFRLSVVGTERSKETADEVMKDIDAYLKAAPQPVRDRFCAGFAHSALGRAVGDPQAIKIGRKYLARVDCLPDCWEGMDQLFDEAERKLKAKRPDKKDDKK
jgi:hypothetical protein